MSEENSTAAAAPAPSSAPAPRKKVAGARAGRSGGSAARDSKTGGSGGAALDPARTDSFQRGSRIWPD